MADSNRLLPDGLLCLPTQDQKYRGDSRRPASTPALVVRPTACWCNGLWVHDVTHVARVCQSFQAHPNSQMWIQSSSSVTLQSILSLIRNMLFKARIQARELVFQCFVLNSLHYLSNKDFHLLHWKHPNLGCLILLEGATSAGSDSRSFKTFLINGHAFVDMGSSPNIIWHGQGVWFMVVMVKYSKGLSSWMVSLIE